MTVWISLLGGAARIFSSTGICGRLSGTSLGLTDHIMAGHSDRYGFCLNRGRFFESHFIQGTDDDFADIKFLKFF